jgi:hypothetical protein
VVVLEVASEVVSLFRNLKASRGIDAAKTSATSVKAGVVVVPEVGSYQIQVHKNRNLSDPGNGLFRYGISFPKIQWV